MYAAMVKVTFKQKVGDETKKYQAKKECRYYESVDEAVKALGEKGALELINSQVKAEFADNLRAKLKAKVTGEDSADSGDIEDLSSEL